MVVDIHERTNDQQQSIRSLVDTTKSTIWTSLPGIIESVNFTALTVSVRPAVQGTRTMPDGTRQNETLPLLVDVPIVYPRGGQYTTTFPVAAGDECLVVFSSRNIDNWWQSGGVQPQHHIRMHSLSDGFALLGPFSQAQKISDVSSTTAQLRSNDGAVFVEVDRPNSKVTVMLPGTHVTIDDHNQRIELASGATSITLDATNNAVTVDGDLFVSGEIVTRYQSGARVTLGSHKHGTGTAAAGTVPPTAGT